MPLWIRFDGLEAGGHRGTDVFINDSAPLSTDMRLDRTDNLGRDGQMAGADFISKRVWDFTLFTNKRTEDEALALASAWGRAWEDPEIRSGERKVPLEYSRDHVTWFRVYGRPTLFTPPKLDVFTVQGRGQIDLQFEQLDPWHYSAEVADPVVIPVARSASGGIRAPIRVPIRVARSGGTVDRWGTNEGQHPAPVTVRFDGPVTDPELELQGHWRFGVRGRLEWDEYLVIDPVEVTATVYSTTSNRTRAAYSMLRTGSRFGDLVMPPGQHAFTFRAVDPTFTAKVTATWPHTYASMQ